MYTCSCDAKLQNGGAIWNGGEIKFLKKSSTEFKQNDGGVGGHVFNLGALIFRGEAVFESGFCGKQPTHRPRPRLTTPYTPQQYLGRRAGGGFEMYTGACSTCRTQ